MSAAAAFLERATLLTGDAGRRATRAIAAAEAKHHAGAPDAARALLAVAETALLDEPARARMSLLRGQMAFASGDITGAPPLLLEAATRYNPRDARLAREACLDALFTAIHVGRFAGAVSLREVALAAHRALSVEPHGNRPPDLLLEGLGFPAGPAGIAQVHQHIHQPVRGPHLLDHPRRVAQEGDRFGGTAQVGERIANAVHGGGLVERVFPPAEKAERPLAVNHGLLVVPLLGMHITDYVGGFGHARAVILGLEQRQRLLSVFQRRTEAAQPVGRGRDVVVIPCCAGPVAELDMYLESPAEAGERIGKGTEVESGPAKVTAGVGLAHPVAQALRGRDRRVLAGFQVMPVAHTVEEQRQRPGELPGMPVETQGPGLVMAQSRTCRSALNQASAPSRLVTVSGVTPGRGGSRRGRGRAGLSGRAPADAVWR
jgi:hypothetical protein